MRQEKSTSNSGYDRDSAIRIARRPAVAVEGAAGEGLEQLRKSGIVGVKVEVTSEPLDQAFRPNLPDMSVAALDNHKAAGLGEFSRRAGKRSFIPPSARMGWAARLRAARHGACCPSGTSRGTIPGSCGPAHRATFWCEEPGSPVCPAAPTCIPRAAGSSRRSAASRPHWLRRRFPTGPSAKSRSGHNKNTSR